MCFGHYESRSAARLRAGRPFGTFILKGAARRSRLADAVADGDERCASPGLMAASPMDFTYYPFTHSLVTQTLAGARRGAVYFALRKDGWGALSSERRW